MSHKRSDAVVQNKNIWTKNLTRFQSSLKRITVVALETSSLEEKCRMPLQTQIIGRCQFLGNEIKGRKKRIVKISKELASLWRNKLNFPHVSLQRIQSKLETVLKSYDECAKRGKYGVLDDLFDITKKW